MRCVDPGHRYDLNVLDNVYSASWPLQFVKREGPKFPGNEGSYYGTTLQEVLRACADRLRYVGKQGESLKDPEVYRTFRALAKVREAIHELEARAAVRHGREVPRTLDETEFGTPCKKCGHTGCDGGCH